MIWCMTHWILYYGLGIDRDTADIAGQWARYILFGLWPTLMFQILKKLLQGGGILWPVIVSSILATAANFISCYITIYRLKWGFAGAAISVSVSQWVGFIVLLLLFILLVVVKRNTINDGNIDSDGMISMKSVSFLSLIHI